MLAFGTMSWPLLVLSVLSVASRGLSNEVVYGDEASASDDVGFWVVYDTSASRLTDENKAKTDQDHPSCLLLKMKVVVSQGNVTIVDVPMTAQVRTPVSSYIEALTTINERKRFHSCFRSATTPVICLRKTITTMRAMSTTLSRPSQLNSLGSTVTARAHPLS